jgi:hypothetical protein
MSCICNEDHLQPHRMNPAVIINCHIRFAFGKRVLVYVTRVESEHTKEKEVRVERARVLPGTEGLKEGSSFLSTT